MEQASFTLRIPLDLPDFIWFLGVEPIQVSNWLMKIPPPTGRVGPVLADPTSWPAPRGSEDAADLHPTPGHVSSEHLAVYLCCPLAGYVAPHLLCVLSAPLLPYCRLETDPLALPPVSLARR